MEQSAANLILTALVVTIPAFIRKAHCLNQWVPFPATVGETDIGWHWLLMAETEEKTEPATPHKKQQARKKGQVAKSADLNSALVACAVIGTVFALRGYLGTQTMGFIYQVFDLGTMNLDGTTVINLYRSLLLTCFKVLAPILGVAMVFGILANYLQVGFMFAGEALTPKMSHINPVEGFKRIFSKRAVFEMVKTLLKITVIGAVVYSLGKKEFPKFLLVPHMSNGSMLDYFSNTLFRILFSAGMAFLIIAVLDFAYQKWQFSQDQKMSKTELKMEMKQTEGDPLIKSRVRQKQRLMAMRRTMQMVPEATVVITNPTHMAIALKYDGDTMDAPQVIAKGAGYMAQKIKEVARQHGVPVIEDRPLAHSLYDSAEVGEYIPVELYQAVAVVLAAIYQQSRNRRIKYG